MASSAYSSAGYLKKNPILGTVLMSSLGNVQGEVQKARLAVGALHKQAVAAGALGRADYLKSQLPKHQAWTRTQQTEVKKLEDFQAQHLAAARAQVDEAKAKYGEASDQYKNAVEAEKKFTVIADHARDAKKWRGHYAYGIYGHAAEMGAAQEKQQKALYEGEQALGSAAEQVAESKEQQRNIGYAQRSQKETGGALNLFFGGNEFQTELARRDMGALTSTEKAKFDLMTPEQKEAFLKSQGTEIGRGYGGYQSKFSKEIQDYAKSGADVYAPYSLFAADRGYGNAAANAAYGWAGNQYANTADKTTQRIKALDTGTTTGSVYQNILSTKEDTSLAGGFSSFKSKALGLTGLGLI